ncbi:cellulose biosynthesis protein BcsQ [Shewanella chilikensis]|uniref:Cellulose biosynthesis protein BcsQ n=1 Tax=Shewanella chilikensis TaxID=558541 RepID=A0ABX5PTE1_9GAMM|nr:AAA family ATPase [Shewanella chilikensis]MCL1154800.1 AAA family ATPase [Shewanella chilikensis]PYE61134.1 cellulose biosynthesis protein BcsQ [Shewanella chilikensis]
MKIISLFNHKGGVSKTTTTFNLGWTLAEQGYKTLVVDADPQCNLTALVLGYQSIDDISNLYEKGNDHDIFSCIEPVIDGSMGPIRICKPLDTPNDNLKLMCGSLKLSEAETQMSVALSTSQALPAIRNIPGCISAMLRMTGDEYKFDYILVDMSPSVGTLNQCILMGSDYFIVPSAPDFFCAQAIKSLSNVLPKWNSDIIQFRNSELKYGFPEMPPVFIGNISQKYRPRNGSPAKSFQLWIDVINADIIKSLVPALQACNMTLSLEEFESRVGIVTEPFNLANISDFNSLIAKSQEHNVPVFALTEEQIDQVGKVLETMIQSRNDFKKAFVKLATAVVNVAQ